MVNDIVKRVMSKIQDAKGKVNWFLESEASTVEYDINLSLSYPLLEKAKGKGLLKADPEKDIVVLDESVLDLIEKERQEFKRVLTGGIDVDDQTSITFVRAQTEYVPIDRVPQIKEYDFQVEHIVNQLKNHTFSVTFSVELRFSNRLKATCENKINDFLLSKLK